MRLTIINLVAEEIYYRIINENKNADQIRDAFNFKLDDYMWRVAAPFAGKLAPLNDMEKHLIRDFVRRAIVGECSKPKKD
jgi:hypothetical protein